jgi:tetratricopeptide (TPR) repeat protein
LIACKGFAHPEVEIACNRARRICERTGNEVGLALALTGLAIHGHNKGDIQSSKAFARDAIARAEHIGRSEISAEAYNALSTAEHFQGEIISSLDRCRQVEILCSHAAIQDGGGHVEGHGRPFALGSGTLCGRPLLVTALGCEAWNLWALGQPDSALTVAERMLGLAKDPFSEAHALFMMVVLHWLLRDTRGQTDRAEELVKTSERFNLPLYLGLGIAYRAASAAGPNRPEAVAELQRGLLLAAETKTGGGMPGLVLLLAETQSAVGRLDEARTSAEAGLQVAKQTEQRFTDSLLENLLGEIARISGGGRGVAERHFVRALEIARRQGAKSAELRVAINLARLHLERGRQQRETADLTTARRLIQTLRS